MKLNDRLLLTEVAHSGSPGSVKLSGGDIFPLDVDWIISPADLTEPFLHP